jgi:hypothetical protein
VALAGIPSYVVILRIIMINKVFIFFIFVSLTGCFESKLEKSQEKHLREYESNIKSIMKNHSQHVNSIKKIEDVHKQHLAALEDFDKVKKHFAQFNNEKRLQTIIALYDYALTHFIIRQVQIIELASPIWQSNITTLEKIKDSNYYQKHQGLLSELVSMIDEYKELILDHNEVVRKKLIASGLDKKDRSRLWPVFNFLAGNHISAMKPLMHPIQARVESEMKITAFLYENKDGYVATKENGLQFHSPVLLQAYNHELRMIQMQERSSRLISN